MKRVKRWMMTAAFLPMFAASVFAVEVNVNVKGSIKDHQSKEPLIGATIRIMGSNIGRLQDHGETPGEGREQPGDHAGF